MIEQFVNILHWLSEDPARDWQRKLARDREIALRNPQADTQSVLKHVLYWWSEIDSSSRSRLPGECLRRLFLFTSVITAACGLLLGGGASLALFYYDGSAPINILVAMVCLVLLPLIGFVLSLTLPFLKSTGLIGALNFGGWVQSVLRSRDVSVATSLSLVTDTFEHFLRWRLVWNSQLFGLTFSAAALAVLVLKVLLSDLAFAWGSTLNIDAATIHQFSNALSKPWSEFVPSAVPSHDLIERSQYFRLVNTQDETLAKTLTQWWPFIAMSLLCYGVISRLVALLLAGLFANHHLQRAFLREPRIVALLDRMNSPVVASESGENEKTPDEGVNTQSTFADTQGAADLVIAWQGASLGDANPDAELLEIVDEQALLPHRERLKDLGPEHAVVRVITKAWEPPLLEFHDFLEALRTCLGPRAIIIVVPSSDDGDELAEQKSVWRRSLAKFNDANLFVQ